MRAAALRAVSSRLMNFSQRYSDLAAEVYAESLPGSIGAAAGDLFAGLAEVLYRLANALAPAPDGGNG